MRLLEYEAKELLRENHIPVPAGYIIKRTDKYSLLSSPIVLKSQVPIGGRGKLGGVAIVDSLDTLRATVEQLFSLNIKGHLPSVLLAEDKLNIINEHYLSLFIDRNSASIRMIAHRTGGIEVERNNVDDFLNIEINTSTINTAAVELATYLTYPVKLIQPLIQDLFTTFTRNDATLLEINPLIYTSKNELVCGDCKMELDDAARFRHPEWNFEDTPPDANFVTLDRFGSIATIANGAGLAMATVDAVAASGMKPANFLDIGGGANATSVLHAFRRIMEFPQIDAIVINIFAGITRCDEVARAIIEAKKEINALPPLFIRLAGTNFEEAVNLLSAENITTMSSLDECLIATREASHA